MLQAPTLDQQLQRLLYDEDQHYASGKRWAFPQSKGVLREIEWHKREEIIEYLEYAEGDLRPYYDVDDDASLAREVLMLKKFLRKHRYSTAEELQAAGVEEKAAVAFAAEYTLEEEVWDETQLWSASTRATVSFRVWEEMQGLAFSMVRRCRSARVSLTETEKREALDKALSRKRKRAEQVEERKDVR